MWQSPKYDPENSLIEAVKEMAASPTQGVERCPTCGRDDYEEAHIRMRCRDPWHADAHLRFAHNRRGKAAAPSEFDIALMNERDELRKTLSDIVERCARLADPWPESDGNSEVDEVRRKIAASIRSLDSNNEG
jgi:hypothetical protein